MSTEGLSESAAATPRAGPAARSERIEVIDILRGFALLGILLVNMELFSQPVQQVIFDPKEWAGQADRLAVWGVRFFAEGKFYSLFSFLFGLGFALQIQRAEARGTSFVPFYLRRLFVLLLIGVAHAILLWVGDILVLYAIAGTILLLLFRRRAPRTLLTWMAVMFAVTILISAALTGLVALAQLSPEAAAEVSKSFAESESNMRAAAAKAAGIYSAGTFIEVTRQRLSDLGFMYTYVIFLAFNVLAMFLLGLYVGRREIFRDIAGHLPLFRKVLWWGLPLGIVGNGVYVIFLEGVNRSEASWQSLVAVIGQTLGAPALAMSYMAAITLLVQHDAWRARLGPLAAVGRMALTNYLLQSLVATTIFYGYGFGLFGQIGPAVGILFTLAIFTAQIPLSVWWMSRFQFGPVEWLWRTLTYLRWQPIRLT